MFPPSPPPPLRQTPTVFFFLSFFVFFCFFYSFFSTPNFEARLQSSNFEVRSSNFEHRLQCLMFPPPPPPHLPAKHPPFFFSFRFLFSFVFFIPFFSTPNFEHRLQSSNFEVRTSLGTPWSGPSSWLEHGYLPHARLPGAIPHVPHDRMTLVCRPTMKEAYGPHDPREAQGYSGTTVLGTTVGRLEQRVPP